MIVYLAVGSNVEPEENVVEALELLAHYVQIDAVSTFYWTEPVGRRDQPAYLNGVVQLQTSIPPRTLKFGVLRAIEADLGRIRTDDKYAPRTIDLDILLYGGAVVDEPDLRLPDPDITSRGFLIEALAELAPDLELPGTGTKPAELLSARQPASLVEAPEITNELKVRFAKYE